MNDIVDMSQFIETKSDQLNADDLIGTTRTITVRRVTGNRVTGNDGEQPVSIFYEGDNNKPFKPCKTMRRVLMGVWGRNGVDYVGRSMTLYRDDKVTFGGLEVGGIRISHMSHIDKETLVVVMKTKGKKAGIKIAPLVVKESQPDAAGKWTAGYITNLEAINDMEALVAFGNKHAARLAELREKRPELHERCMTASQARAAAISEEGPDQTQRGEHFATDADADGFFGGGDE